MTSLHPDAGWFGPQTLGGLHVVPKVVVVCGGIVVVPGRIVLVVVGPIVVVVAALHPAVMPEAVHVNELQVGQRGLYLQ